MKKNFISYFLIICTILLILSGCTKKEENNKQENQNTSNTEISKLSTTTNTSPPSSSNDDNNTFVNKNTPENKNDNSASPSSTPIPVETDLGTFSTNIIDKRENRQNNIRITCSKLNGLTVESGKTFSFCNTVRKINC